MGLLAIVAGKARRLGLVPWIIASLSWVSLLVAVVGVLWLAVLPQEGQFRGTYISENALLPHQASTHFRETEWHILRGFREQIRQWKFLARPERMDNMRDLFDEIGLSTATMDDGSAIYAILHAPRGSHNEAIVLTAPWTAMDSSFNDGGVAILVSLARFFRRWSIWHKNIVFVLPDNGHEALRKWVEAYHTGLQLTAGSVEGAIVLDFSSEVEHFDHIEVLYEQFNGQLPNLDLVNVAVKVAHDEWVRAETGGARGTGEAHNTWDRRMRALISGIIDQVVSGSRPNPDSEPGSAMFSGWRIDAVTLRAIELGHHDITTFGRVAEGVVRSVNNLLEHFHQSFFFYLMMGPQYFVSIATYLPSAILVANSFPLMALYLVLRSSVPVKNWATGAVGLGFLTVAGALASHLVLNGKASLVSFLAPICGAVILNIRTSRQTRLAMHSLALILLGLALTALAMVNFGLALVLGIVSVPLAWLRHENYLLNAILLSVTCPATVLAATAAWAQLPMADILRGILTGHQHLNVWTGSILGYIWVPSWLIGVAVAS